MDEVEAFPRSESETDAPIIQLSQVRMSAASHSGLLGSCIDVSPHLVSKRKDEIVLDGIRNTNGIDDAET